MKILVLSRYTRMGASSRYRTYQYFPYLKEHGFDITVAPLLDDIYIKGLNSGRKASLSNIFAYGKRLSYLLRSNKFDLIWLEKEVFPWIPSWIESAIMSGSVPYVVDYDDATFHRYDQHASPFVRRLLANKIKSVMRKAVLVIAGNDYLAAHAQNAGARRIEVLPTVIDLDKYPVSLPPNNNIFTIGWIGSPGTAFYLIEILPALRTVCRDKMVKITLIGAGPISMEGLPLNKIPWDEITEVQHLKNFDVGIMPLSDSPWERGKCGCKLIQYMASVRPVVGSPVGVNSQIITNGIDGFHAMSIAEWVNALIRLRDNRTLRQSMGERGRLKVEREYCLQVTAPKLAKILKEAVYVRY